MTTTPNDSPTPRRESRTYCKFSNRHWKWRWAKESCTFSKEEKESRYKRQKSQAGKKLVAETASTSLFLSSQETSVPASNPRMSNANFRGIRVFLLNRWSQFLFLSFFFFLRGDGANSWMLRSKAWLNKGKELAFHDIWHLKGDWLTTSTNTLTNATIEISKGE